MHAVSHGPETVVQQVVARTDGVPLFVEELTKMALESGLLQEQEKGYELSRPLPPLAIPATLQDSLPETPAYHQADESHRILQPIAWGASAFIKGTFPVVTTEAAVA
jgi:hypothetical protein